MVGQWVNIFLKVGLSGWKMLMSLMRCQLVKKVKQDTVLKLTLNVLMNYMNYTMIIHYPMIIWNKHSVFTYVLSKDCKEIADKHGIKVGDLKKLIPNLGNKTKYVLYHINLQLYLPLGMKLTKIHRVLKFKQSDWMKNMLILTLKKKKCS